jgi:hypothetical protein
VGSGGESESSSITIREGPFPAVFISLELQAVLIKKLCVVLCIFLNKDPYVSLTIVESDKDRSFQLPSIWAGMAKQNPKSKKDLARSLRPL